MTQSTTISGLPNAATPLTGAERIVMDQGNQTVDATTQDIANLASAAVAPVQSVALLPPSGWSTSSTNTGGSVTLTLGLPSGFSLPTNASQAGWDTAYSMRGQWSGGATGLNAAIGRASLELGSAALAAAGDFATSSALTTGLAGKADLVGGVIPSSQIPAIAISDYLGAVASQAAMLALTGQRGDWCLRTDGSSAGMWVLSADNAALLANWVQIPVPIVPVQSVNGQTGVITLGPGDVGAATAAQGVLAASAVQPAGLASTLSSYLTIANGALTYQPLDGDLTAIAGLSTFAYGRSFLALANAAAGRTWLELGTAATAATGDFATPAALSAGLATKADLVGGVVPSSQIPAIALVQYLGQVSSQTAMLALRGQGGDWCIRTDGGASEWVIVANDGALLADWVQMPTGTAGVSSINGQTGAVTLGTGDLGESGGNLFFTAARAIGSALTGFVAEAGTVAATDSILQAINKIVGNIAGRALAGTIGSSGLTMTAGVLGRESGTGAPQVYPLGSGLSIVAGAITATATGSSSDYLAILASSEVAVTTTATATISRQHLISGTTADYTVTLPAAAGNAGKFISFRISDAATRRFTISGNASELINGQNTRIMWAGESAVLYCDGSGWLKLFGVTKPMQCQISLTSTQTISNLTMTDVTFSRVDVDNTGAMADTANSRIINFRPGQYILMAHLMWDNTTGSATRLIGQIFNSNTSSAITAHEMTAFAPSCYPSCQPYALVALLATSRIKLQAYKSANVTNVYGHPTTDTTQLMAIEVPSW